MPIPNSQIPGFICSDPQVQAFCERELRDFNPYDPEPKKTARQLLKAAIARFGLWRCYDIEFWEH
jgi:hypothetical protein